MFCLGVRGRVSHREFLEVFMLLMVLWAGLSLRTQLAVHPHTEVPHRFRAGDDVEGGRQRGALVEVAHPQLRPSKLPLNVSVVLHVGVWQRVKMEDTFKLNMV